ncbi:ceramidase domain-containing protein [Paracoccus nototheniae]|uniref:Ceramidase domain-containing protein n=1 Tax=Paracoccus nototheniae TaxID=2489002 RepID=A0ABW4DVU3_9RHOB|nr:ceramidase domain-containing protein [Paracoccus nototheniae]
MDWFAPIDAYCERTGPEYWSEPVNAVTNLAFLIAALIMAARLRGPGMAMGRALAAVLFVIGIGSWLFHTHANGLTSMMDVLPIVGFILLYVFAATRDYFGARPWVAGLVTVAFLPYAAATVPLFAMVPGLGSSASYAPLPLLIFVYALLLRHRSPATARGLAIGAGILVVSLTFRTLDRPLCDAFPLGTHPMWHILNAVMLGWMIEVWRRHRIHSAAPGQK